MPVNKRIMGLVTCSLLGIVTIALACTFAFGARSVPYKLPDNFLLGYATSSYQIEGAWNENGKGESCMDYRTHNYPEVFKNETGDVACDSYHKYKEDVAMLKHLGAQVYRFSLSWTRILPAGDVSYINQDGIDYYNNLIDELLRNGIQPMVTLYHWDDPQILHELRIWNSPDFADYYENFTRIAFENFGDRVKYWITFNEPKIICVSWIKLENREYENENGEYLCTHHLLLSHARAYHLYNNVYRPKQKGKIGITLNVDWFMPKTNSPEDVEATKARAEFEISWFAHPLLKGDYPPMMRERIDALSRAEGRTASRLPTFDRETAKYVKGTVDFLGMNHYTSYVVAADKQNGSNWAADTETVVTQDEHWPKTVTPWLKVVPRGFRKALNWIKNNYGNVTVIITENGYSDEGDLEDNSRIDYHKAYMKEMLKAIYIDGCHVAGYMVWSLMDNFEWIDAYTVKFGVYHVDFDSPNRTRTPKSSVDFFRKISLTRVIPN